MKNNSRDMVQVVCALIMITFTVLFTTWVGQQSPGSSLTAALAEVVTATGPLIIAGAALVVAYVTFLRRRLMAELLKISGPGIVQKLLPHDVMRTLLTSVYGANDANQDVISGVLGGGGVRPHGDDLTISTSTSVDYQLSAINDEMYTLTSTATYRFKSDVRTDRVLIFVTSNPELRDQISVSCLESLYEVWFADQALLLNHMEDVVRRVQIGMRYKNHLGQVRAVAPSRITVQETKVDRWPDYLKFFREGTPGRPRRHPVDHLGDLRVFECDLTEINGEPHVVDSIESLTLKKRTHHRIDDGYCHWQAPYPCYVESFQIEAEELVGDEKFEFRAVPFSFRTSTASTAWADPHDLRKLDIDSWMLPGHGIGLVWRKKPQLTKPQRLLAPR